MWKAVRTAELLSRTTPYLVFTGTLHADEGCPLYEEMRTGTFMESTVKEYLQEEECFLWHLEMENSCYFGLHPSNIVRMYGFLPKDKDKLLHAVAQKKGQLSRIQLESKPVRGMEKGLYSFEKGKMHDVYDETDL